MTGFQRTWAVRFSDIGSFGIAHYPCIMAAIYETADGFVEEIGVPFWMMAEDGFGLPIVEVDVEFESSMGAGDEIIIELTPTLGDHSIRFEYVARREDEGTFSGYEQRVCARTGSGGAMELPENLRTAMMTYDYD